MRAFEQPYSALKESSITPQVKKGLERIKSVASPQTQTTKAALTRLKSESVNRKSSLESSSQISLLNSYGIINDEWSETSYLGMNILINVIGSSDIEVCAQASAKINTILHSRNLQNVEESCYLIASIEKYMYERPDDGMTN